MKIGKLVKYHTKKIFQYCETVDHAELQRLENKKYSKMTFGIGFPFCLETSLIPKDESKRYWTDLYLVRGKTVRVSSQWILPHKEKFISYLIEKNITRQDEIEKLTVAEPSHPSNTRENSRYKGNAIGNSQNLLVRNILSNLGGESFKQEDWENTKKYFDYKCAYCGSDGDLVIEHAIPINKVSLGEHRLGNLVPSCKTCNSKKADKDYKIFLDEDQNRIDKIEKYMDSRNYTPLGENEQVAKILEMAYEEVATVSKRYITIINEFLPNK